MEKLNCLILVIVGFLLKVLMVRYVVLVIWFYMNWIGNFWCIFVGCVRNICSGIMLNCLRLVVCVCGRIVC